MSGDGVRLADVPLFEPLGDFVLTKADLVEANQSFVKSDEVDWGLVVLLRRRASERISREIEAHNERTDSPMPETDRRLLGRSMVRRIVREYADEQGARGEALWPLETERAYAQALENAIYGYGRLQPLFEIPDAENIEIAGCDSVMVQFGDGHREAHPPVADSDEELVEAVRFLGESVTPTRPFDDAHPTMTLALGDRFRLHAIGFGLSYRPSVTIRQHILTSVDLPELVDRGMMPEEVGRLLHAAVLGRRSVVISGDQGAGKTTLLRAMIASIPANERFGTLETDYELLTHLQPTRRNMLALQARIGLGERQDGRPVGEFTVADLIPEALRQNLSRLVVGEVRGSEAGAMFEAMQAGAGTLSTTHSHDSASTMDRLAARVAQGGVLSIDEAFRQIAHHIALIVHVSLIDDTWRGGVRTRRVSEVRRLTGGMEGNRPVSHLVYRAATDTDQALFHPEQDFLESLAPFLPTWRQR
ncbi:CpaF family protein [Propioniciclava tarda]|uniref:CpaF family protein n=1 Tax=Propioniciclava tarda TaxID=433330 RepID=A0A4Q9KP74_PROTD|nr:CpaF/VirB11 family protein [Propioniciclava tarda]TBT96125.1 CpaF family protein [Propioniciclava tarda]SMO32035.1 Pilus assembly protein, ATPase of CpaF family [Propioniciclava tarda]HOA89091.1 CpaF/VirB11 family protein [Propioniciclava tarda]HQA31187.1 CpaF/VirB11 family protein [Propioniciclava tarda]HQD60765.1 CpaF/VirB11 family protein [Propioniciclava tarda]